MPKKVILEDGSELEVPTEEEATKTKEEQEARQKEFDDTKSKNEELQKSLDDIGQASENIPKMRQTINTLKKIAKDKGVEVDDNGDVIDNTKITQEEIQKVAQNTVNTTLNDNLLNSALASYSEEDQKTLKHQFDKLTAGEQVNAGNFQSFFGQATNSISVQPASINPAAKVGGGRSGGADNKEVNFADTEEGKGLASILGLKVEEEKKKA